MHQPREFICRFRLTEGERTRIEQAAREADAANLSEFVRRLVLGRVVDRPFDGDRRLVAAGDSAE